MMHHHHRPTLAPASPAIRPDAAPPAHRLALFGGGALHAGTRPVAGRAAQRHRIALLALLATTRRLHRSRDQLVFYLWPDTDAERGRRLLSDSIYRINSALGGDVVTGAGDDVRLNRGRLSCDVADFEAACGSRDWERVVALYAGPFLDGFYLPGAPDFDQWMEGERTHYARAVAKAHEALATDAAAAGRLAEAAEWWERLAALVPDDSRVALGLTRAQGAPGNRAGAVAVLPFDDLGDARDAACFADGVSDELMYVLTRTPGLRVASRTSSFACRAQRLDVREIARRLDVDWVIEGSVRRHGERLRIATQLSDARSGFQLWSESFDRTASDLIAVQTEIAAAIAARVARSLRRGSGRDISSVA